MHTPINAGLWELCVTKYWSEQKAESHPRVLSEPGIVNPISKFEEKFKKGRGNLLQPVWGASCKMGLCARLSRSANPCVLLAVICTVVMFNLSHHMSKYLMQSMSVFKVHGAGKIGVRAPYLLRRPDRGADLPLTKSSHRRDLIAHATSNTSHKPYSSHDSRYSRFSGLTGPLQVTRPVAYLTREFNSSLAKSPLNFNGGLAKLEFTPFTKSTTGERIPSLHGLEKFPPSSRSKPLFPDPYRPHDDRILAQMDYRPDLPPSTKPKVILSYSAISGIKTGVSTFHRAKCKVKKCVIQYDLERWASRADAVLFTYYPGPHLWSRRWEQVWILSALESPFHTVYLDGFRDQINWTATYRTDSVLVTPYEKFLLSDNISHQHKPRVNYAANKTKLVAWFVSNCMAKNQRMGYGRALSRYIQVDIFGACGSRSCPRERNEECFDMLKKDYKFYLAFENSNCRDYITEKLFVNALAYVS